MDADKNQLLDAFKSYLEQNQSDQLAGHEQPDLHTLLTEMAGLKTEVKAESRQFKATLDALSSALASSQDDNKALAAALAAQTERLHQQQTDITRALLLEVVDIYDRLSIGLEVLQNYQPATGLFKSSNPRDVQFIGSFREGQDMTVQRFGQWLQQHQVQAVACVGHLFDPLTMTAVETGHDPKQKNGLVLEELRKGFLFQNQVLRLAEVKVNKIR